MTKRSFLVVLFAGYAGVLCCSAGVAPHSPDLSTPEARAQFAEQVIAHLRSTPAALVRFERTTPQFPKATVLAQMDATRIRCFIWTGEADRPQLARFKDGSTVQEFTRKLEFKNGTKGTDVLVEYPEDSSGWSKTVEHNFACNLGLASDSWMKEGFALHDTIRDTIGGSGPAVPDLVDGRQVLMFRAVFSGGVDDKKRSIQREFELGIDRDTNDPVILRQKLLFDGKEDVATSKETLIRVQHVEDPTGLEWRLTLPACREMRSPTLPVDAQALTAKSR